ncbi:MAG TPA: aldo/keto reductase [Vitreimonas sp.]|uniref:aldo/keto reductase n=1 Tax=Vitreimonas sp. TaxID=3069702 RepID=UPI002D328BEB|nr:aldo/keto reductase [Vitreimonas sp.]HYD86383.1 aldo/keto reductase [Vitreimonas sp.]
MANLDSLATVHLNTGRRMPVMGLGTWQLTHDTAGTVAAALKLGYPMIDTSGDYGTQPGIAEGIKKSGRSRKEIYIVSKVEDDEDAYDATHKNLRELDTNYADLMLIHRPPDDGVGELSWRGLIRARDEGLVRDIGVSNYSAEQIDALVEATGETPAVNQIEWSPFGFSEEMLDYARENNIVLQAYSPLTRDTRLDDPTLRDIAARHGKSPAQVLIRWDIQRGVVPVPKANRRAHLEENIDVFDFDLSRAEMKDLEALNERYSALGRLPYN